MAMKGLKLAPTVPKLTLCRLPDLDAVLGAAVSGGGAAGLTALVGVAELEMALAEPDALCDGPQPPINPAKPAPPASTTQLRRRPRRLSLCVFVMRPSISYVYVPSKAFVAVLLRPSRA